MHTSRPLAASADPAEMVAVLVYLEELPEVPPITLLTIEFTQEGEVFAFRLPVRQGLQLHRALQHALSLPYRA